MNVRSGTSTTRGGVRPWAALLLLLAGPAAGAGAPDGGTVPAEGGAAALQQALDACSAGRRDAEQRAQACREQASAQADQLAQCRGAVQSCQTARAALCSGIGDLARWVVDGAAPPSGLGACLPADRQGQVGALLAGWGKAQPALEALLRFAAGETDAFPRAPGLGETPVERTAGQLLASDPERPPILYRRILVAALERVAPRFWERLRAAGPGAVGAWFTSSAGLEPELVAEARRGAGVPQGRPGAAGPPLAAALEFVQTYLDVAGCARLSPQARDCVRARQLQELLESSGPLVVQRRDQAIWATDCRALGPRTILEWLQDFPAPQQPVESADWAQIADTGLTKLYLCFLKDPAAGDSFLAWAGHRLPGPQALTGRALARLERMRRRWVEDGDEDLCARAVRVLQRLPGPTSCSLPRPAREALGAWLGREARLRERPLAPRLRACAGLLEALWQGKAADVPGSFGRPPTASELVRVDVGSPPTAVSRLRSLCEQRRGGPEFPAEVGAIADLSGRLGESPETAPWRVDPATGLPFEQERYRRAGHFGYWLESALARRGACEALGLPPPRCELCGGPAGAAFFDCALLGQLERRWEGWRHGLWIGLGLVLGGSLFGLWLSRFRAGWRRFGPWSRRLRAHLETAAVAARPDRWRWLWPSRLQFLAVDLPAEQAWERWGRSAVICRAGSGTRVLERDVNRAAARARAMEAELALLVHDEGASPDLGAVRALLEWAGRGSSRAVQVLPVAGDRLQWIRHPGDLLDLVEQTSLRGNPFEIRGRITSASQFFDRERLVSGLLAGVQAGSWVFVGGLRRFGKSSLALEVARRLPGPSAYVDLAGFYHEIAFLGDPSTAADAILRYLLLRLHESARARYGSAAPIPQPPPPQEALDAARVAGWFREFAGACARAEGHGAAPILLILDEIEQAIGVAPDRLQHALDVFSILVGRLRAAFGDPIAGGTRVGVLLCGVMHPLLWAPLPALAGQSLMGALQSVFVPRLPDDAAHAMMRGLGARQGIRFTDPALRLIVQEAQGVALLVRRIGSSVLELYDPERARQGSLGAVEIGVEGATAALRREEEEGSPLRVWVESEIGDPQSPAGSLLRRLAREGRVGAAELRHEAAELVERQFAASGIDRLLAPEELRRRVGEAAAVTVRMLGETGLLVPEGDLTAPEAYAFPDGVVRRILASGRGGSPFSL